MKPALRFIFPVKEDIAVFDNALELALKSNAKLYLLYTYRISDIHSSFHSEKANTINRVSFDESIHHKMKENFGKKLSESNIQFEYLVEIGFLPDRLIANISEKHIDLVILSNLNSHKEDGLIERMEELTIPVLIIPGLMNNSSSFISLKN